MIFHWNRQLNAQVKVIDSISLRQFFKKFSHIKVIIVTVAIETNVVFIQNSTGYLKCLPNSSLQNNNLLFTNISYKWFKDGKDFNFNEEKLEFKNLNNINNGIYKCFVRLINNQTIESNSFNVIF